MKWEADQAVPFFGYSLVPLTREEQQRELESRRRGLELPPRAPAQPRWKAKVEINHAFEVVGDVFEVFVRCVRWPQAQPFSGGVWDAWPARLADGLAFCRAEWAAINAYMQQEVSRG